MRFRLALVPAAFALMACNAESSPPETTQAADTGNAQAQIEQVREAWLAAEKNDDAATVAALYTDDAVFVGSQAPIASGRAAIQSALSQSFPGSSVTNVSSSELEVGNDIAYDYGTFTQQMTPPNAPAQTVSGYYLVVLERQGDGSWKISKHMSATPPAEGAASPAAATPATPAR